MKASSRMKVVFAGMVAADAAQGGAAWAVLQYVLGLKHLGHDVCFVEPISSAKLRPGGTTLSGSAVPKAARTVPTAFCVTPERRPAHSTPFTKYSQEK